MTKTALLLLALCGLGDDSFAVRRASERYLAASGYAVVPLNRLASRLTDDLETRARLRKLHRRYYAAWDAKLATNDWRAYPSLITVSPHCIPHHDPSSRLFTGWEILDGWNGHDGYGHDPLFYPLAYYYCDRATEQMGPGSPIGVTGPDGLDAAGNIATLLLCKDLRSREVPAWVEGALLGYLHWRTTSLERRYKVRDHLYCHRR
jgi:hypothetical protein